jgi:hypothetical protein
VFFIFVLKKQPAIFDSGKKLIMAAGAVPDVLGKERGQPPDEAHHGILCSLLPSCTRSPEQR